MNWLTAVVTLVGGALGGGGFVAVIVAIARRPVTKVEAAERLNDSTLEWADSLKADNAELRREIADGRRENAELRREVAETRHEIATMRSEVEELMAQLRQLHSAIAEPAMTIERLRQMISGPNGVMKTPI